MLATGSYNNAERQRFEVISPSSDLTTEGTISGSKKTQQESFKHEKDTVRVDGRPRAMYILTALIYIAHCLPSGRSRFP